MINNSFQLLRTNTRLTTNIKLVITSDYKLFFESFDTNKQLSDQKYKHYQISKNNLYEDQIVKFFQNLPSDLAFDVKYDNDNTLVYKTYDYQFDDIYWSGAKLIEDKWYNENYEYFAPLYIKKDFLPEGFVILRVDDTMPYEVVDNQFVASKLTKDNFFSQIVDKWKCVQLFDLRYQSDLGFFLSQNFTENDRFPSKSFELDFKKYNFSRWYGIDYDNGVYVVKDKFLQDTLFYEQPHFRMEKTIIDGFKDNKLIYPHILNLKFLFNDVPSSPNETLDFSMNRYYGFYIDNLEFVTNITSYITPELKQGVYLYNNIFCLGQINGKPNEMIESPFVEGFLDGKDYWIQYENNFYQVVKVFERNKYLYKIISEYDMKNADFTKIYDNACFINYEEGFNYKCRTILNPSGYTNFISGLTNNFSIDLFSTTDSGGTHNEDMYADLYLINIDGIYHVLKKRENNYFIQSDYAINSFPTYLEYWKAGKDSDYYVYKNILDYKKSPIFYSIYRLRFSDIKDFDFDRINSHFSDFDYEKDTYHATSEPKLYATDYLDLSISKDFKVHPRGEDGQYQIMNVSSEYIADDELFEVYNNDLSEIWRKNPSCVKWGFVGSNCQCDYPYKLNNSIRVGDVYNRTTNVFSTLPNEAEKNLDYFYRIGNFISGSTTVRYFNQTTNIETDLMDSTFSGKFNLDVYLNSNVDYFEYFFKNKMYYRYNYIDYIKNTCKYSTFNSGDQYSPATTLFKGIQFNAFSIDEIIRDDDNKISGMITNQNKNFNDYKFATILNDVYYYDNNPSVGIENGLSGNTFFDKNINGIHIFLNEKFKNILIVINIKIPIQDSFININNVPLFNEKTGLYDAKTIKSNNLSAINNSYDPSLISAPNFINAINNLNDPSVFDSGITYYYVNLNGFSGTTGPINIYNPNNSMTQISDWAKDYPPFIITILLPELLETKRNSYNDSAIKGPKTNIYNKYETYFDIGQKQNINVNEPLARVISLNQPSNIYSSSQSKTTNLNTIYATNSITTNNFIYRYNGSYEPIFKDIPLFKNSYIYNSPSASTIAIPIATPIIKNNNLIKNGGGLYTTDWINPTSQGIAQYWADTLNVYCFTSHPAATEATFSIVQGNGFTGNAQRIAKIGSVISSNHPNCIGIYNNFYQLDSSKSYDLSFKYRSNTTVFINNQYTINSNPATAISVILTGISFTDLYLYFSFNYAANKWFEIDEIYLNFTGGASGGGTGGNVKYSNLKFWKSNYKFNTELSNFGTIEELVFSKVNPTTNPLKLKNTDQDKSIYPMVDEYGFDYRSRFIFNSNWDKDFYTLTKAEQNIDKTNFMNSVNNTIHQNNINQNNISS